MKDSTLVIIVVAVAAGLFFAFRNGFLSSSPTGLGINARTGLPSGNITVPQPATNYSGFLAASTAPQVSNALGGFITGLSSSALAWLSPKQGQVVPPQSGASTVSPSLGAQPSGPWSLSDVWGGALVGPQIDPVISYDSTNGSSFGYDSLAADNAFDPMYSFDNTWG